MLNKEETQKEIDYLKIVSKTLADKLGDLNEKIESYTARTKELSKFISDNFYDMDAQEIASQSNFLENLGLEKVNVFNELFVTEKQAKRPYFGRIDFTEDGTDEKLKLYIGLSFLESPNRSNPYVIDWRAPISSLYYDYEVGKCKYASSTDTINGEISLKRQYKVEGDKLIYAFDSNVTINDDILQQALGQNSSSKMKDIVSTIQKEQNEIIRTNDRTNLIVQGIAGSGKTSIALHRIAYLIYKNKIASKDIVIISPSPLFSDYIANVLPELGEQNVSETTFEEIARTELENIVEFESRTDMLESLLLCQNERTSEVAYKESFEFFNSLKTFLNDIVSISFHAKDIKIGKETISKEDIDRLYNERYKTKKPSTRIDWISDYIIDRLNFTGGKAEAVERRIKRMLLEMFDINNIVELYKAFLTLIGMPTELFTENGKLKFEDVAPILYIKDYLLGTNLEKNIKYVVIDEMQDYSPIALDLILKTYPCPKTILGDIYQSVERNLTHQYLSDLENLIDNSSLVKLAKTYRSTLEISEYCQKLIGLQGAINFTRHGEPVKKLEEGDIKEQISEIIKDGKQKGYKHIAIICPSLKASEELYYKLPDVDATLLTDSTSELPEGAIIVPATICKGLEFDEVVSVRKKPGSYLDRNLEYITCTRALHELIIIETKA